MGDRTLRGAGFVPMVPISLESATAVTSPSTLGDRNGVVTGGTSTPLA